MHCSTLQVAAPADYSCVGTVALQQLLFHHSPLQLVTAVPEGTTEQLASLHCSIGRHCCPCCVNST